MRKRTAKKIISRVFWETVKITKGKDGVRIKRWSEALEILKAKSFMVDINGEDILLFARFKYSKSLRIYDDRVTKIYRVKRSKIKNL